MALLGRYQGGTLRDIKVSLPTGEQVVAMRFDGALCFANVSYFEDAVLEAVASHPNAKCLFIVGDAINQLDSSGKEVAHHLVRRLRESGLKKQVLDIMQTTGLIGLKDMYATENQAIAAICGRLVERNA